MSTYSHPIVFVGQSFENQLEALDFLYERKFFTNEEYQDIEHKINTRYCCLEECLGKFKNFPSCQTLNYVTGQGYFIGYTVAYYKTEDDMLGFLKDIDEAQAQWQQVFNEAGKVFIKVQTS